MEQYSVSRALTPAVRRWTIADLDRFPDDGLRYELIDGELFVSRAPGNDHQEVCNLCAAPLTVWNRRLVWATCFPALA